MKQNYILLSFFSFFIGMAYFAYNQEWLIFRWPQKQTLQMSLSKKNVSKKKVKRIYWYNGSWQQEETELIWPEQKEKQLLYLLNSWLTLLDEERIMSKRVTLQSVALSPTGNDIFISFDRNPFNKLHSAYEKWMWLEGLLKTIRENDIKIQRVQFLVHHQSMHDFHLDFSNPWPLCGFL